MRIKNIFSLTIKFAALVSCGAGLVILSGVLSGRIYPANLVYYTNLSNLACLAFYVYVIVRALRVKDGSGSSPPPFFRGVVLTMLTVTMLVYHYMLATTGFIMRINEMNFSVRAANYLLHYAAPALCIIDWLVFDNKRSFKPLDPLKWLAVPFVYFIIVMVRAHFGGAIAGTASKYPYYFLDLDALGMPAVMLNAALFAAGFAVLGYVFYFIDRFLGKIRFFNKKTNE